MPDPKAGAKPPKSATIVSADHPLIILQTSPYFEEPAEMGREVARVWKEVLPDDIRLYCQAQVEIRMSDHEKRYHSFQRLFDELQKAEVPANFQFADPHDVYVFDPIYVEKLTQEYPCIKSFTITEIGYEHYSTFNVPRYAVSQEARYAIDHIGPRHLPRQTSVWGHWIAGAVEHWGVEPQSWWFENGRMITPGVFGQREPDNTRIMPPGLYRAMILMGAMMGATVYQFEPFWDLFDYDNSHCWRDVIYPTLMEVINRKLIPARETVMEKTKVAYQLKSARDINEFHENLRDVDQIGNEGLLQRAAYGVWEKYLEHELIPNKGQNYFIPLLPPKTPDTVLRHFAHVIKTGECDSVAGYEKLLAKYYRGDGEGNACIMSMNGYTYVMQTHENLYERQDYAVDLPAPVCGLSGSWTDKGLKLEWSAAPGAGVYHVRRRNGGEQEDRPATFAEIATSREAHYVDTHAERGKSYTYTVTADTRTLERKSGTVNYLDYLVFSQTESLPGEVITVSGDGVIRAQRVVEPEDTRPASQVWYPTFDGAEGENLILARQIVTRIDQFKQHYDAMDWRKVTELYSARYQDPNGFHREYVGRAWKWWFFRNNICCMLRQIRWWDFGEYANSGVVRVKLFSLFRATRRDDQTFGYRYDGTVRVPRHFDEEVVYSWVCEDDGAWRIIHTDPAIPNFEEMLWNSRGSDHKGKLRFGVDD
ncbi:MAG: hypothetical protein HZB26_07760 [Candidatus Hydrogenedentes bacterium]|nr:hypothetical protein [Candidatus Hydrogenedentota bacterium]